MHITHDPKYQQFTIALPNGDEAELAYSKPSDEVICFTHTFVPENFRNKGLAEKLIIEGFTYAKQHNLKVLPGCDAVASFLRSHPEYQEFLM